MQDRLEPSVPAQNPTHEALQGAVGKTVRDIEYGFLPTTDPGANQTERIILHFSDGSKLVIDTGSNAKKLAAKHQDLKAGDVQIDLYASLE